MVVVLIVLSDLLQCCSASGSITALARARKLCLSACSTTSARARATAHASRCAQPGRVPGVRAAGRAAERDEYITDDTGSSWCAEVTTSHGDLVQAQPDERHQRVHRATDPRSSSLLEKKREQGKTKIPEHNSSSISRSCSASSGLYGQRQAHIPPSTERSDDPNAPVRITVNKIGSIVEQYIARAVKAAPEPSAVRSRRRRRYRSSESRHAHP